MISCSRSSGKIENLNEFTKQQLRSWSINYHEISFSDENSKGTFIGNNSISADDFFETDYLAKESGGKTKVVLVNRVYKEATDERMEKLIDEIKFIESIPSPFKEKFPQISYYKKDESAKKVYYEMSHYELPSMRRMIFSNSLDVEGIMYWSDKITKFSMVI